MCCYQISFDSHACLFSVPCVTAAFEHAPSKRLLNRNDKETWQALKMNLIYCYNRSHPFAIWMPLYRCKSERSHGKAAWDPAKNYNWKQKPSPASITHREREHADSDSGTSTTHLRSTVRYLIRFLPCSLKGCRPRPAVFGMFVLTGLVASGSLNRQCLPYAFCGANYNNRTRTPAIRCFTCLYVRW